MEPVKITLHHKVMRVLFLLLGLASGWYTSKEIFYEEPNQSVNFIGFYILWIVFVTIVGIVLFQYFYRSRTVPKKEGEILIWVLNFIMETGTYAGFYPLGLIISLILGSIWYHNQ